VAWINEGGEVVDEAQIDNFGSKEKEWGVGIW